MKQVSVRTVDHVLMSLPYKWSNNISDYNQSQLVSTKCPLTSRLFPSWKNRTFLKFSNFERYWPAIWPRQLIVFSVMSLLDQSDDYLDLNFGKNWVKINQYIHIYPHTDPKIGLSKNPQVNVTMFGVYVHGQN